VNRPPSTPPTEAEQILQLQRKLAWAELKIQVLEEQLRLQRIKKYGPASEKLSSAQLELLEPELCTERSRGARVTRQTGARSGWLFRG